MRGLLNSGFFFKQSKDVRGLFEIINVQRNNKYCILLYITEERERIMN